MQEINPHCRIGRITYKAGLHALPMPPSSDSIAFFRSAIEMAIDFNAQAVGAFIIAEDGRVVSSYHQDRAAFSQVVAGATALHQRVLKDWE